MIVKGSAKIHNSRDRFVVVEWGEDEAKQGVLRFTTCDGRLGREIAVEEILRRPCEPAPANRIADEFARLLETQTGAGIYDWSRENMESVAGALVEIGRTVAASNLRAHWIGHHRLLDEEPSGKS